MKRVPDPRAAARSLLAGLLLVQLAQPWSAAAAGTGSKAPAKPAVKPSAKKGKAPAKKPPEGAAIERPEALNAYFETLLGFTGLKPEPPAGPPLLRVAFFGDSHTAAGFWPGRLRTSLQGRLGDGGPGLVLPARPWRGYPRTDLDQEFSRRWSAQSLRTPEANGRVGLAGAALAVPAEERLILRGAFGSFRLHLLGLEGLDPQVALAETTSDLPSLVPLREIVRQPLEAEHILRILEPSVAGPFPVLSFGLPEGLSLLGVDLLSGSPGAVVDELGLNGGELLDLEKWNPVLRASLLANHRPSLLVLAFGTNDLGHRDLDGSTYRSRAARLLKELKEASGAPVLLVGPLDRMGRRRRGQNLKLGAQTVIAAMRGACADAGCAFWNAKAAMGGEGSIQKWRRQHLAQRDLVHLTVGGYQKLADLMLKALDDAEADWRKRQATVPE